MDRLPSEVLHQICALLLLRDLLALDSVNRLMHAHCVELIYASIQHIHLFSCGKDADAPSLRCLESLAFSATASSAVRHLTMRGVPWQDASTMHHLALALRGMDRLVSLDTSAAPGLESLLLSEASCADPHFLPGLEAIHVASADTALYLCAGRRISSIRVASEMASRQFLKLLAIAGSSAKVRQLQAVLSDVSTPRSAGGMLRRLTASSPGLAVLGLEFKVSRTSELDMQAFSVDLLEMMNAFSALKRFSLVITPLGTPAPSMECPLATALMDTCSTLTHLELQWKAWVSDGTNISSPEVAWNAFMRTSWAYTIAEPPVAAEIANVIARKRYSRQQKLSGSPAVSVFLPERTPR
ncbi:hypothetical protein AURDEDRAFT_158522 [Auricularia subglabra TFB-10046 SS5]|nr:hypothetical protein AURDEDRAFT_158522 [Auricularia subglabra TFB-10046 SS5]